MRKLLSIVVVALLSFTTGHSQGVFDIGAGGGFPVFDASDFSKGKVLSNKIAKLNVVL